MPKRSSTTDPILLAARVFKKVTETPKNSAPVARRKNPHAVALGRKGGLKGGVARAERLTAEQRRDIARLAARARWEAKAGK